MKFFIVFTVMLFGLVLSCSSYELNQYETKDLAPDVEAYFVKNQLNDPGKKCGTFKKNKTGCFILNKNNSGKAVELIYKKRKSEIEIIKKFDKPVNYIFIQKYSKKKIVSSAALEAEKTFHLEDWQESVVLHYFEKSSVVFFWNGSQFDEIWISD